MLLFFFRSSGRGLGVGDLIWRKPGIRLGGTPSLDVTSKESSRRHCLAFWGGVQFTHVTDSINFKHKDFVLASKKNMPIFFSRRWRCHSPNKRICYQTAKKNAKNGSLRWLPLLVPQSRCDFCHFRHGSVSQIGREMFQSGKKTMSIFDKSLFNGWITPKHKTKSQQFRFYLLMPSPTDFGSFTFPDVHHFSNNLSHKNGIVYSCW